MHQVTSSGKVKFQVILIQNNLIKIIINLCQQFFVHQTILNKMYINHSGLVIELSTTVPGGGLFNLLPAAANKRVLIPFLTIT